MCLSCVVSLTKFRRTSQLFSILIENHTHGANSTPDMVCHNTIIKFLLFPNAQCVVNNMHPIPALSRTTKRISVALIYIVY